MVNPRTTLPLIIAAAMLCAAIVMPTSSNAEPDMHKHKLKNEDGTWKYTNRLEKETSPYLLQHAHNPVDWYPWGDEAFKAARESGKPIFLSIGYSTCYWCHVMERQCFENPEIAAIMNKHFINVKIDREERPDVDDIYMNAVQLLNRGQGGWPASVFLTPPGANGEDDPGLKPFFAGTYFPPEPIPGRPSFPQVMNALSGAWSDKQEEVLESAEKIADAVSQNLSSRDLAGELSIELPQQAAAALMRMYDKTHGGFGQAPKFPTPNNLDFLMTWYQHEPDEDIWQAVEWTLERMARGGMYDQIGGGFHRYSVDEKWLVPHFEKMLYDNGQLLQTYAEAHAIKPHSEDPNLYPRVMRGIAEYVLREMRGEDGTFYSAQDAEVDAREGGNYVWTKQQVIDALKPLDDENLTKLALEMYGLSLGTNFQDPHHRDEPPVNVLYLPKPLHKVAESNDMAMDELLAAKKKIDEQLMKVRDKRKQPGTDDKVIVSWNGMMIAGLARAGVVLDEPKYIAAAEKAMETIIEKMMQEDGGLKRTMRHGEVKIDAFLEDYAFLSHAFLELYRATGKLEYGGLGTAMATVNAQSRFAAEGGGYYDTLADQKDLFVRTRGFYDGAISSGNSQMANNFAFMYELSKDDPQIAQNRKSLSIAVLKSYAKAMKEYGPGMANSQRAYLRIYDENDAKLVEAKPVTTAGDGPVTAIVEPKSIAFKEGKAIAKISLTIEPGFHINSNKPGNDWLIPTEVRVDGKPAGVNVTKIDYPDGEKKKYEFAEEPISVHETLVVINVQLERKDEDAIDGLVKFTVRFQACTEDTCLAPKDLLLAVPVE